MPDDPQQTEDTATAAQVTPVPTAPPGDWRRALGFTAGVFLLSRLLFTVIGLLGLTQLGPMLDNQVAPAPSFTGAMVADMWGQWDASWYIRIANDGYQTEPPVVDGVPVERNYAFFPAFPMLVRGLFHPFVGESIYLPGLLLNNVLALGAFFLIHRLCERWFDVETARLAVLIGCLGPYSFVFSSFYTESLFLLLFASVLLLADRRQWLLAGLCGAVLSATRPNGCVIALPAAVMILQAYPHILRGRIGRDELRALGSLPLYGLGLLGFMVFLHYHVGDAMAFAKTQGAWGRVYGFHLDNLLHDLFDGGSRRTYLSWYTFTGLVLLHTLLWRRQWALYTAGIALLLPALVAVNPGNPFGSMPRFMLVLIPLMIALALLLRGRPLRASIVLMCLGITSGALMLFWVLGSPLMT